VAAHGIRLPLQRIAGGECRVETIPKDRAGVHFKSIEHTVDCGVCLAMVGHHGLQKVLH